MYLLNKQFWIATAERAIKTFVQALIAAFGVGQVSGAVGVDIAAIDWRGALSLAFSAALLSVLMSIGSGPIGPTNSPSVVSVPVTTVAAAVAEAVAAQAVAPQAVASAVPAGSTAGSATAGSPAAASPAAGSPSAAEGE